MLKLSKGTMVLSSERQSVIDINDENVLKKYAKAVVCMRKAYRQDDRFGLILGAGINKSFDFAVPQWQELIDQLAADPKVNGVSIDPKSATLTARAEILYRHFAQRRKHVLSHLHGVALSRTLKGEWSSIIRSILYENLTDRDHLHSAHGYLDEFLEIILRSPLTINYNFDSFVEMMLQARQKQNGEEERKYVTVFDASPPFRSSKGVIYHPNGYLPENVLEGFSDDLVFSEQEFGEQLMGNIAGRNSTFLNHLSKNTCLFLGVSFNDENLRHLLRQSAINSPGHYHYCVHYVKDDEVVLQEYHDAVFEYRYEVYNLITLFLTSAEIAALGRLLKYEYGQIKKIADRIGCPLSWVYYLTGIPGIGKTSVARYLGSLYTLDEWMEEPLPELLQPWDALTPNQQKHTDTWTLEQFAARNRLLAHKAREGVFLADRAPLDPLTYGSKASRKTKARLLYDKIAFGHDIRALQPGAIILLLGDVQEITSRLARRQPGAMTAEHLTGLQNILKALYTTENHAYHVDTRGLSFTQQVKAVARFIYREEYQIVDIQSLLTQLAKS